MVANLSSSDDAGPWNPGISSQIPAELRSLTTLLRPGNVTTSIASALELEKLTGFQIGDLVAFRPRRLVLHEVLVRVMADFSVPDGSRIEDLGINFREIVRLLLARYLDPEMDNITAAFTQLRSQLSQSILAAFADITAHAAPRRIEPPPSLLSRLFGRSSSDRAQQHRRPQSTRPDGHHPSTHGTGAPGWGLPEIAECERRAAAPHERRAGHTPERGPGSPGGLRTSDTPRTPGAPRGPGDAQPLQTVSYRCLARVMSALFTVHGQPWGTPDLIASLATDLACNLHGSELIGDLIDPILQRAAAEQRYMLLPPQTQPVIINTKGPSASGKSTLRPLQKRLAGALGVSWSDFALISPDIWRKQLLDYSSLGDAYKYAGTLTSDELQIIDQKLDRYMARKQRRGSMSHLLIDRFRFDSFAADSDEAGSNLLTRFGHSVYLFFMITPPDLLVERAWKRGLEVGRYKAVDDTLAHSVEAYTGMPDVFFTWVRRGDKSLHFEFLDNSVRFGDLPRTVAFGSNDTLHVLDVGRMLDIERFGRVNVDARSPQTLYPDQRLLAPEHNLGFLRKCIEEFREVVFADQSNGRVYLRVVSGTPKLIDREALQLALQDPDVHASLKAIVPTVLDRSLEGKPHDRVLQYLNEPPGGESFPTVGQWGRATA